MNDTCLNIIYISFLFFQFSNVENLSPQIIRQVSKEIADLCNDPPEGIKIFPNEEDITDIQAQIEGPCKFLYWENCQ